MAVCLKGSGEGALDSVFFRIASSSVTPADLI